MIALEPQLNTRRLLSSVSLLAGGGLAMEIALTRLLSTLYYPPYIFAVLSLAILGIGLGSALAAWREPLRRAAYVPFYIALAGASTVLLVVIAVLTGSLSAPVPLVAALVLPYTFIGLALASLFSLTPERSRLLYAADLAGAGLGAVAVIPLLNLLGAVNTLLVIALLFFASSLLYAARRGVLIAAGAALALLVVNVAAGVLQVDMAALGAEKPIVETLATGGEIVETRRDAFARTDLVAPPGDQPYRLYVDGAAASVVPPVNAGEFLMEDIGLFAFVTAQPERVFSLGTGGGLDVWFALRVGAEQITAVEVNPESVALVRDYDTYTGGIYERPEVRVLVDEGRSVLRRDAQQYDLVFLSQVVTLTAERTGYALTENTVFTREAFADYLDHLAPGGYLAFKLYDEPTLSRTLSLSLDALAREKNLSDAEALRHIIVLLDPDTSPPTPLLMLRETPFAANEVESIGRAAQRVGFAPLYLPGLLADPPLDAVEAGTRTYASIITDAEIDLSVPTDDRPFFYQFERGLPDNLSTLLVTVAGVVVVGLGVALWDYRRAPVREYPAAVLYFAALGMGFIMTEITLIQQTRLFIGHPTIAVTTVLAVLLVSGGAGSLAYDRQRPELTSLSWRPLALIAALLAAWIVIWPLLSDALRSAPLAVRVLTASLAIAPLGFALGIPFAAGLRVVGSRLIPVAWMVNALLTVLGSVTAVVLAILFGYVSVLLAAFALYIVALLSIRLTPLS